MNLVNTHTLHTDTLHTDTLNTQTLNAGNAANAVERVASAGSGAPLLEMAGLLIDSSLCLPELAASEMDITAGPNKFDPEVLVVRHCVDDDGVSATFDASMDPPRFAATEDGWELFVAGAARVHVSLDGRRVFVAHRSDADPLLLAHLVVDQAVPRALVARGRIVLHATCVAEGGLAFGFLGPTGTGKSTLALGFAAEGAALVADDCLVVTFDGPETAVVPSYPSGRLCSDSVAALGLDVSARPAAGGKRRLNFAGAHREVPLAALFLLERSDAHASPSAVRLTPGHAAWLLARNAFGSAALPEEVSAAVGAVAAMQPIVCSVPVFVLRYPSDLDGLSTLRAFVRATVADAEKSAPLVAGGTGSTS